MDNVNNIKEVHFYKYCYRCVHKEKPETDDPCWWCLQKSYATNSRKPMFFEQKEGVECRSTRKSRKKRTSQKKK